MYSVLNVFLSVIGILLAFTLSVVAGKEKPTYRYIMAACGDDINLPCDALQNSENYTSVTWYKVRLDEHLPYVRISDIL